MPSERDIQDGTVSCHWTFKAVLEPSEFYTTL